MSHCQTKYAHTYWTLKQSLALIFLPLSLINLLDIMTVLAVEIVNLFLETESTHSFCTFDAKIHFLFDELSSTAALVVDEW